MCTNCGLRTKKFLSVWSIKKHELFVNSYAYAIGKRQFLQKLLYYLFIFINPLRSQEKLRRRSREDYVASANI